MIYFGNFYCLTNQQEVLETERRHAEFSMVVETHNTQNAIEKFRDRIVEFRNTSDFFEGNCTVYFLQILEFASFPQARAMMLNYKSVAGDPVMPFIGCVVPTDDSDYCRIHTWENNAPEVEGQDYPFFIQFTD